MVADDRLQGTADRFLATGALDRSVPLRRLFDFLLACTLAGKMPREIDVAQDVFGRTSGFDMGQDATIRVQVHRLRRKLEEFRLGHPDEPAFMTIPRGEYRLMVADGMAEAEDIVADPTPEPPAEAPVIVASRRHRWLLGLAALLLLVNIAGWAIVAYRGHGSPVVHKVEKTVFWSSLAAASGPTVIVVGDYYIFGEAQSATGVSRLVREFSINSRDDLDEYLMTHPDRMGQFIDLNLHYLPIGTATALHALLPVIDDLHPAGRTRVLAMSQLTPEIVKNANLIYVGYLSGLGLLRNLVFDASSLKVGDSYDELIDRRTGTKFTSDWSEVADGRTPQRDFGYLANIELPGGKRLMVIAGTRDAALMQAADSAADPEQLRALARRTNDAPSTEAVVEVNTMGNAALAGKLVLARPLRPGRPTGAAQQAFPDEFHSNP